MADISSLNDVAKAAAELAVAGGMTITSARRDVPGQAHAMASNVVHNEKWIVETYADSPVRAACQKWVDENEEDAKDVDKCAAGLLEVLHGFSDADLRHLSWHLAGDAFDCEPDGSEEHLKLLHEIVAESIASGGEAKLLTEEGGLVRWHVQIAGGSPPKGKPKEEPASGHADAAPSHSGPAYPGEALRHGSSGDHVETWQKRLAELGHDITADGHFGEKTEEATKQLQSSKGLTDDGVVGEHTWAAAWS